MYHYHFCFCSCYYYYYHESKTTEKTAPTIMIMKTTTIGIMMNRYLTKIMNLSIKKKNAE